MGTMIHHPTGLPVQLQRTDASPFESRDAARQSSGRICFELSESLEPGVMLEITIPLLQQSYRLKARVVESRPEGHCFRIFLTFPTEADAFLARAVEQACHIESYRMQVEATEGRRLTPDCAAMEWIEKFAADFPTH